MAAKKCVFKGAATALITPFKNGKVDYEAFGDIIEMQIAGGIDALVVCGTTGEPATLTNPEHLDVIKFCVDKVAHRVPVIAGTGSNETSHAVYLSKEAERLGADALLLVTPYYNKCSQKGIVKHFETVADSVNIPCIIYNVPGRTGFSISLDSYKALSKHPNIVAAKEASGNMALIMGIISECGENLPVYSGDDQITVPLMSLGAIGVISVFSDVLPAKAVEMTHLCLEGKFPEAAKIQLDYLKLMNGLFMQTSPIPVKTALCKMGYCDIEMRMPLCPMDDADNEKLFALMREYGLTK